MVQLSLDLEELQLRLTLVTRQVEQSGGPHRDLLICELAAYISDRSAKVIWEVKPAELEQLAHDLSKMHADFPRLRTVDLESREHTISLAFELEQTGHVLGHFMLLPDPVDDNTRLEGSFNIDQSYLPVIATKIREFLKELDPDIETFWRFIRGDMRALDFEEWVYAHPTLERLLGAGLYFQTVSADYDSSLAMQDLKKALKLFAVSSTHCSCMCIQLSNIAVVAMGEESKQVFRTLVEIKRRGEPYWWLSIEQCSECQQFWLVASEERQNDVYCLYRLDENAAGDAVDENRWPSIFDHYEYLYRLGLDQGRWYSLTDPLEWYGLRWLTSELARNRPGIKVTELAEILNLDVHLAKEIAERAVSEDGVHFIFDAT